MTLRYLWINVVETLLRVLPFPCRTGLIKIGQPNRSSPVLLTGNFQLTVERVKRAIDGIDAYLLVANSQGPRGDIVPPETLRRFELNLLGKRLVKSGAPGEDASVF